jgi:sphingomyelin phosphodiesterase acid-like 3
MGQVRASVGNIPVMFAVGNSDSYLGALPEPGFLSKTADIYYTKFLNGVTDRQAFLDTFTKGGYYSVEPPGTELMVIGLNTALCALPETSQVIADELAWLDSRLASAKATGKKVWLLMHVPPGADINSTANKAGANGHIDSTANAAMMWQPESAYQASFLQILSNHPGVVTLALAAHTHMDEFRILSPSDVLEITPSITPYFGNYPAFKVFSFSAETLRPTDYSSLNYDLATLPGLFTAYYTFSEAYSMQGFLNDSRLRLYPALVTDSSKQTFYKEHYFSGNLLPPPASTKHSQISTTTWPVFWSGIGKMGQQEFFNSVNSY